MARDLNKVMLTGRLGKDVELRVTPNGSSVASFSVAAGRPQKMPDGSYKDQTEWFRVVAWEKLAETCANYLKKGSHVYIEGRLQTREYTDKDGVKRYSTEVIASEMLMLDSKRQSEESSGDSWDSVPVGSNSGPKGRTTTSDDDLVDPVDMPF